MTGLKDEIRFLPRLRVMRRKEIAVGPGKADLLEAIARDGSIAGAARSLRMSYARAWSLVRTMNACFRSPLVEKVRGGAGRGGARLTERGEAVLKLYRDMERKAARAIIGDAAKLRRLM